MTKRFDYLKFILLLLFTYSWSSTGCTKAVPAPQTIGQVLCNIKYNTFSGVFKLIFVIGYVSGTGLLVAAIFKLKQVKDNPTQIPVSTPMVLFLCAALSIFMPSMIAPAGETIFGASTESPSVKDAANDPDKIGVKSITNLMQEG